MKKTIAILLSCIMLIGCLGISVSAAENDSTLENVITSESEYYLSAEDVVNGGYFTDEELAQGTQNGAIILCGVNVPLSETNSAARGVAGDEVWCRSYATYDEDDGVQVYIKLYMPWWNIFSNPKFTSMSGLVTVTLDYEETVKAFYESADEERSIETDVDTGAKAESGTTGTVMANITVTGTNIESGIGYCTRIYEITIP